MSQLSLISLGEKEKVRNRRILLSLIKKKRVLLQKLIIRSESLKVKLDILKREYMVKIGSLVTKDNHLDLEIIKLRNLISLLEEGMTYENALKELEGTFYAEQLEIEREEGKIRFERMLFDRQEEEKSDEVMRDAKKLWRKLITLFHPDLTQEPLEKKRREGIMKLINEAYEVGDIAALSKIERDHGVQDETSVQSLEEILTHIENDIVHQEMYYEELKSSEWYRFEKRLIRSRQTLDQMYADLEKKLLGDILGKIEVIKEFKREIGQKFHQVI